jgi:hypothetical protein
LYRYAAAHLLMLKGGATATRMEWIDADQFSEIEDGPNKVLDHISTWKDLPPWSVRESVEFKEGSTAAAALGEQQQGEEGQQQGEEGQQQGEEGQQQGEEGQQQGEEGQQQGEEGQQQGEEGQQQGEEGQPEKMAVKIATMDGGGGAESSVKPRPGFKVIEGFVYSWDTQQQLPKEELENWQARAAERVAAMTAAHPGGDCTR